MSSLCGSAVLLSDRPMQIPVYELVCSCAASLCTFTPSYQNQVLWRNDVSWSFPTRIKDNVVVSPLFLAWTVVDITNHSGLRTPHKNCNIRDVMASQYGTCSNLCASSFFIAFNASTLFQRLYSPSIPAESPGLNTNQPLLKREKVCFLLLELQPKL